jgi:hypothetical protein
VIEDQPISSEFLEEAELAALEILDPELREHVHLCGDALNLVGLTLNRMPERSVDEISSLEKVVTALLEEAIDDFHEVASTVGEAVREDELELLEQVA